VCEFDFEDRETLRHDLAQAGNYLEQAGILPSGNICFIVRNDQKHAWFITEADPARNSTLRHSQVNYPLERYHHFEPFLNGHALISQLRDVVELNRNGQPIWRCTLPGLQTRCAIRLVNGDTLMAGQLEGVFPCITQVDRSGKKVQEFLLRAKPDIIRDCFAIVRIGFDRWRDSGVEIDSMTNRIAELTHHDSLVRLRALQALRQYGPRALVSLRTLIDMLGDQDREIQDNTRIALLNLGPKVFPALASALQDKRARVRAGAASTLGGANSADIEPFLPNLIEALKDTDAEVRESSAGALGALWPCWRAVVPVLTNALADKVAEVRIAAARALGRLGPSASSAVPTLINCMESNDERVFLAAVDALQQIHSEPTQAIPALVKALKKQGMRNSRPSTIGAIAGFGSRGHTAVSHLIPLLGDSDPMTRRMTAYALGRIGLRAKSAVPQLVILLKSETDTDVLAEVIQTLGRMGPAAKDCIAALSAIATGSDPDLARLARLALELIAADP
jgi:HEAT repeat protein